MDVKRYAALSGPWKQHVLMIHRGLWTAANVHKKERINRNLWPAETWNISMPALGTFGQLKLLQERLLKLVVHLAL